MLDKEALENQFGQSVVVWCSFCNSQPGEAGTLTFDLDGAEVDLPICQECLDKARAAGKIDEDN